MNKYIRFITDSAYRFKTLDDRGFYKKMPDERYLKKQWRAKFHRKLDLENPQTFNEKLQWLKLYDRNPLYTTLVDKYAVRQYIKEKIGEEYLIPLVGGPWKSFDEIDFEKLPEQFVLKCTHDSGGLIICRDKSKLDIEAAREKISRCLQRNYYLKGREWPYKNVPPQIIAEKYMTDEGNANLPVYKIFCFDGEPRIIQTIQNDKQANETIDYFDTEWNLLKLRQNFPNSEKPFEKPSQLSIMLAVAKTLSKGKSFIRVDLYTINGEVKFSEHTFYSDSGTAKFEPDEWDATLGTWLKLPENSGGGYTLVLSDIAFNVYSFETVKQQINYDEKGQIIGIIEPECLTDLKDYKFMCFNGKVKCTFVCSDRFSDKGLHVTFFDRDWNVMPFERSYSSEKNGLPKPKNYEKMLELAEVLSKESPFVRVDFYEADGKIYFGELTFFPGSGMEAFQPEEWDYKLGDWITLPK